DGRLAALRPLAPGWPGLILRYLANGQRQSWHAALTGTESMQYNSRRLPQQRLSQNGDTHRFSYDAQGRPISVTESRAGASQETRLAWHGALLTRVQHPHATEIRGYDTLGRLARRQV